MHVNSAEEKLLLSHVDFAAHRGEYTPKPRAAGPSRARFIFFSSFIITFLLLSYFRPIRFNGWINGRCLHGVRLQHDKGNKTYEFKDIKPSEELHWKRCYGKHLCARLTVPMDYHRPLSNSSDHPKVHVALLMLPGESYWKHGNFSKSPLLINPGGPGGSGTAAAVGFGPFIQKVVGEDQAIVGFDPRGIGFTEPLADCFAFPPKGNQSDESPYNDKAYGAMVRMQHVLTSAGFGLVNTSDVALDRWDAHTRACNKLCEQKDNYTGKDSIMKYMSTPSVARDMLSIVDAWDAWQNSTRKETASEDANASTSESVTGGEGKLVYWGFSYGTLLGATFAAMFPDRVGKVVLDGVVDGDHYVTPIWDHSIEQTDNILNTFPYYCQSAGKKCSFYREGETEWDLEDRFFKVIEKVRKRAIYGADELTHAPVVIDYTYIRSLLWNSLYHPIYFFPVIANQFSLIEDGNWQAAISYLHGGLAIPFLSDASRVVLCTDKRYPLNDTLPHLHERFQNMSRISSFADVWMTFQTHCDGWSVEAIDPPMPWDDHPIHRPTPINTSFPVMFVSNTRDPVTPLSAGIRMARKFVGAGLLVQQSEGHCSLSSFSTCTVTSIRRYFREGRVPPPPPPTSAEEEKSSSSSSSSLLSESFEASEEQKELEARRQEGVTYGDTSACMVNEWPWRRYTGDDVAAMEDATEEEKVFLREFPKAWDDVRKAAREWEWFGRAQARYRLGLFE